jgi:pyruvate dehydrogenase E2 component (dihydrolipoamide acetyltransferase)
MVTDIMMPDLSTLDYIMETGTLVNWLKKEGENVKKGEPLFKIMSAKAVMEIDAPESGKLSKIVVAEGAEVPPGTKLGEIA